MPIWQNKGLVESLNQDIDRLYYLAVLHADTVHHTSGHPGFDVHIDTHCVLCNEGGELFIRVFTERLNFLAERANCGAAGVAIGGLGRHV